MVVMARAKQCTVTWSDTDQGGEEVEVETGVKPEGSATTVIPL